MVATAINNYMSWYTGIEIENSKERSSSYAQLFLKAYGLCKFTRTIAFKLKTLSYGN